MGKPFMVDFDIDSYKHLWPEVPPSNEIINIDKDVADAVWERQVPARIHMDFIDLEKKRLREGAFIYIKDQLLWLPPNYYHFLENGIAGTVRPEFRLKELENNYFKLDVRANPHAKGTMDVKNRQDGRTTRTMSDILWEAQDGVNYHGQFNIQSKTNKDSFRPCWTTLQSQWLNYPKWLKDLLYSDFASGQNIETSMSWKREEKEVRDGFGTSIILPSRNLSASYYPAVFNAQDGSSNVLKNVVDEFLKWIECDPAKFLTNTEQFMQVGSNRKGLYEIISSPSDFSHKYMDFTYDIWTDANPANLNEYGTTKNGLFRFYSDPRKGIDGFYDKYGDANPEIIVKEIMYKRSQKRPDQLLGEIRANPLNEEEMFGTTDNKATWDNSKGLSNRKLFLSQTIYKNEVTKEPLNIWGNLEWKNGLINEEVVFRANDVNEFDISKGRFCFSEFPDFKMPLTDIQKPPAYIDSCLGVDPFHLGKGTKQGTGSMAGGVNYKFRAFGDLTVVPHPTGIYNCRTPHIHEFFEDMIKWCVFTRAKMQYEKSSDEIERYFDERGYAAWILNPSGAVKLPGARPEIGRGKGGGAYMTEVMSLINILTNKPLKEGDPYPLEHIWFEPLIDQIISLNREETSKSDLFMALGQAVIGAAKLLNIRERERKPSEAAAISHILGY